MKNLLTSISIFIVACIFLSSCSNDLGVSVIKRKHNKGYYVSFKNNKQNKSKTKHLNNDAGVITQIASADATENDKKEEGENVKTQIAIQLNQPKNTAIGSSPIVAKQTTTNTENTSAAVQTKTNKANKSLLKKQAAVKEKVQKRLPKRSSGGGLLWTIIVIILLLWLAGFLLGETSGLIHLLLVIVLVLLILRLLGLI